MSKYALYGFILASSVIFIISFVILFIKLNAKKIELKFLLERNLEYRAIVQVLEREKTSHLQQIQRLNSDGDYLNKIIKDTNEIKAKSFDAAKIALLDVGSSLTKELMEAHKRENKEIRELSEKNISSTAEKFHSEFERIVTMISSLSRDVEQSKDTSELIKQSLLSPSGAGALAEITLENILKNSGLRSDLDFIMQYTLSKEDNLKLRPDAVIFLPSQNLMVVDAKASKFLVDSEKNEDQIGLIRTMNTHLKQLSSKEYGENLWSGQLGRDKNVGNIVTLMFLPSEHAVEKIAAVDLNFMQKAWSLNIFPVGPSGLMNMLSFARFQISDFLRMENHKHIIEEVRKLLTSISLITEHAGKISGNIQSLVNNYDKFAGSFNRMFLSRAKNMQKLGVLTNSKSSLSTLDRYELVSHKSEILEPEILDAKEEVLEAKKEPIEA